MKTDVIGELSVDTRQQTLKLKRIRLFSGKEAESFKFQGQWKCNQGPLNKSREIFINFEIFRFFNVPSPPGPCWDPLTLLEPLKVPLEQ